MPHQRSRPELGWSGKLDGMKTLTQLTAEWAADADTELKAAAGAYAPFLNDDTVDDLDTTNEAEMLALERLEAAEYGVRDAVQVAELVQRNPWLVAELIRRTGGRPHFNERLEPNIAELGLLRSPDHWLLPVA